MKKLLIVGGLSTLSLSSLLAQGPVVDTVKIHRLQEVSVIGTRAQKQTPMSYTNVKKEALRKVNLGQDVPFLLQLQPSVIATSDAGTGIGYTSIRVRGVDATGVNVTANGVPINDSESQAVFWVNMPDLTSSIEEMQLQRGIGTSSNGAGSFGASLNMRTNNLSTKAYGELSASGGSFGTLRLNARAGSGTIANHWAIDARVSKINSNGYVDRGTVDLKSYFVQAGYFNDNTVLKLISFGGKEVTGIAWNGLSKSDEKKFGRTYNSAGDMLLGGEKGKKYYHNTDNYQQIHNHLIFTHRVAPELAINLTGHYTAGYGYTHEYRTGRTLVKYGLQNYTDAHGNVVKKTSLIRRKYLDNDFAGFIANANWTPKNWDITLGISGNFYKGLHYGELPLVENVPYKVDPTKRYYDGEATKLDLSSYLKLNYQLTSALSAYADLQFRRINYQLDGTYDGYSESEMKMKHLKFTKEFNFFNPKGGLYLKLSPKHHAYASVAIAHREPNRKMYTDIGALDKSPKPERMTDYELGYGYTSKNFSASANLYYMKYSDQIVTNGKLSDVGELLLENVPNSYRLGAELMASYLLGNWLKVDYTLAISKNKIEDYTYSFATYDASWNYTGTSDIKYKDTDLAYSPSIVSSGAISLAKWGAEVSAIGQYVGAQYMDNTMSVDRQIPAYTLLNLRFAYDLTPRRGFIKKWSLHAQVNNLLNRQYHSNGYVYDTGIQGGKNYSDLRIYPQAGINFLVGTSFTF